MNTYEITTKGDGDKDEIILHLEKLIEKLKKREVVKSMTHRTLTENGGIETMIDAHSFQ